MNDKTMIFDGTQYIDVDEIAVIYPTVTASETQRSVRLKSGHVHNSDGTIHELAELVAKGSGMDVTEVDWTIPNLRFADPGRKIDD